MAVLPDVVADVEFIVARRHDNGDDLWATPDRKLAKGGPFSTLGAARLLTELRVDPTDPILVAARDLRRDRSCRAGDPRTAVADAAGVGQRWGCGCSARRLMERSIFQLITVLTRFITSTPTRGPRPDTR